MDSNFMLDPLQFPVSPALSRRRMGSFNTHSELGSPRSPEGSLRRRKSRNMNEDETLMDFLRQSGHDNATRERKSYGGSLDRSWARRNRSDSSSRKRPDLFNVDFNADRERANSPAPSIVENKEKEAALAAEAAQAAAAGDDPSKPRISKEWHQKIQNWLQHNDDGKRPSVDYKKTRVSNRRSYDEDSEGETRKLDPLPEEPTKRPATSKWQPSNTLEGTDIVSAIEAIQGECLWVILEYSWAYAKLPPPFIPQKLNQNPVPVAGPMATAFAANCPRRSAPVRSWSRSRRRTSGSR